MNLAENSPVASRWKGITALLALLFIFALAFIIYGLFSADKINKSEVAKIAALQSANDSLRLELESLKKEENKLPSAILPDYQGITFEVQIGAFEYFDLEDFQNEDIRVGRQLENNLNEYTIGRFTNYTMAENFLKDIRRMGIKDAFIVARIDGRRVSIKEAVEAQTEITPQ